MLSSEHTQASSSTMFTLIADRSWPDGLDAATILLFAGIAIGLPAVGYMCAVLDFRAYLRSLRRALVHVSHYFAETPEWVHRDTPPCFKALGLNASATEDQIKRAYHRLAEIHHPDRGGDPGRFQNLHRHYENALELARRSPANERTAFV